MTLYRFGAIFAALLKVSANGIGLRDIQFGILELGRLGAISAALLKVSASGIGLRDIQFGILELVGLVQFPPPF